MTNLKTIHTDWELLNGLPPADSALEGRCAPSQAAYACHSFDSNGASQFVVVDHKAWTIGALRFAEALNCQFGMRALNYSDDASYLSLAEMAIPLAFGGTVYVPQDNARLEDVASFISEHSITWAMVTPSLSRVLEPTELPTVETLVFAREAPSENDLLRWRPHVRLLGHYGCFEAGTHISTVDFSSATVESRNIGRGCGVHFWLVEPNHPDRLTPIGAIGEILVEGPQIARGYMRNYEASRNVFLTNPAWAVDMKSTASFSPRHFVKTGDLARYNEDGTLSYIAKRSRREEHQSQSLDLASQNNA